MLEYLRNLVTRRSEEKGASAVEYGLLVAAIAAIIVVVVFAIGQIVNSGFENTCTTIADEDTNADTVSGDCTA